MVNVGLSGAREKIILIIDMFYHCHDNCIFDGVLFTITKLIRMTIITTIKMNLSFMFYVYFCCFKSERIVVIIKIMIIIVIPFIFFVGEEQRTVGGSTCPP